jgi:hypothetical protein
MVILGTHDSVLTHQSSVLISVRIATGGMVFVLCLIPGIAPATNAADDSYIAGYAAAVLEHEFNVPGAILQVHEGVVILTADSLGKVDRPKVIAALERILWTMSSFSTAGLRSITNLSFEEVDLKLSYDLASWFRTYGGGGILVGRDQKNLKRGTSQLGAELTSSGPCGAARLVRWPLEISRPTREVIGELPIPSWRGFNSRMRESEIGNYNYWRSISAAPRPTGNSMYKTPSGSDLVSTCISDAHSSASSCSAR